MRKTKKVKKVSQPGPILGGRLPNNRGEWLSLVIKFTKRAIDQGGGNSMVDQLQRLVLELNQWKIANPKEKIRENL